MRKEKREAAAKDFDRLLADEDLAKLQAAFDTCDMKCAADWASGLCCRSNRIGAISRVVSSRKARTHTTTQRCTFASAIFVHTNGALRPFTIQILAACLPGGRAPTACRSSSRPITWCRQPNAGGATPGEQKNPETQPPADIAPHPHFGRCHRPTVSLRLTTGHRGRKSSEQSDRLPIPYRNQRMPTRFTDTASAYDGDKRVR
ncbi:hypothetical protein BLA18112_00872 [Burkholderia lata]|uniref:Uncharacterized protein n=1 Tax=Burkholderia lata (strain ATCC 17760 / DSM 23089 / LMG 22485 / NCIMB 9086 / R18194 / 383) TaxID=482957 RepID=A0A6P2TQV9_BURL3|nr:hypothetical protein BLA18112_00872 [Burkholderia lata]